MLVEIGAGYGGHELSLEMTGGYAYNKPLTSTNHETMSSIYKFGQQNMSPLDDPKTCSATTYLAEIPNCFVQKESAMQQNQLVGFTHGFMGKTDTLKAT